MWNCSDCGNSYPESIPVCVACREKDVQQRQALAAVSRAPARSFYNRSDLPGVIFFGCVIAAFVVVGLCSANGITLLATSPSPGPEPYAAVPAATGTPLKPKVVLSDKQKYDRARSLLASWGGNPEEFGESIDLIGQIPLASPLHAEASKLKAHWIARKAESYAQHVRNEQAFAIAEKEKAKQAIKAERESAKHFSGGSDGQVAIGRVEIHHSTQEHIAPKGEIFVFIGLSVLNNGTGEVYANPNDFTLADSEGSTSPPHIDTYGINNYFPSVTLSPGQQSYGWLIFLMNKDGKYKLTRKGTFDSEPVEKDVIP